MWDITVMPTPPFPGIRNRGPTPDPSDYTAPPTHHQLMNRYDAMIFKSVVGEWKRCC